MAAAELFVTGHLKRNKKLKK